MLSKKLQQILKADVSCFHDNKTVAEENRRKFILLLAKHQKCCRIHVDNCLIKSMAMQKCDFWFHVSESDKSEIKDNSNIFVELKGQEVDKAYSQIISTIDWFKNKLEIPKSQCYAAIVASKVPQGTVAQMMKRDFKKKYGQRLEIQAPQMAFKLS